MQATVQPAQVLGCGRFGPAFAVLPNGPGSGKTEHILREEKGGKA